MVASQDNFFLRSFLKGKQRKLQKYINFKISKARHMFYISYRDIMFERNESFLTFCLDFLVMQKNGLIRKIRSISKLMTSQYGKRTIEKHILPNVSRRKGNQTMKFCQLKEYSMRNIFLENHTKNVVEKVFPETFLKNQN